MGRPSSSGSPAFRFTQAEVAEMEARLQQLNNAIPSRTVIQAIADKFTASAARAGKTTVQYKQVWNWFQNRRYSQRSRTTRGPLAPQGKMLSAGADEQLAGSFRALPSASAHSGSPSEFKRELRSLNRELQLHILELADILVERPSQHARRVEDAPLTFKNLHHLLNFLRPHQARATLIHMLESQIQRRKQVIEGMKQ